MSGAYPGGLSAYIANARRFLAESRDGVNPFKGCKPKVSAPRRVASLAPVLTARTLATTRCLPALTLVAHRTSSGPHVQKPRRPRCLFFEVGTPWWAPPRRQR